MLLNDIGKTPSALFNRVNHYLENNYGFKLSESIEDADLNSIEEQISQEITNLRIQGQDSKDSPEISKRLLILEGIRNLREYAITGELRSPKLDFVVDCLANFVVETFEISGTCAADFDKAVARAMEEYRSSKYRFPDDYIEQCVRQKAESMLRLPESMPEIDLVDLQNTGDSFTDAGIVDTELNKPHVSDRTDNQDGAFRTDIGMQSQDYEKGIVMKENLVKHLRTLLETEVSRAEVMMAAKGFAQELQEMIEKIGRLQNEDLPPVSDQMRETYGAESSAAFQSQIAGALQSVMDSLYAAKSRVDDAVSNMALTGQVTAAVDMEKDIEADVGAEDLGMGSDLDNIESDLESGDEFGADETEEPLGRSKKQESVEIMKKKLEEMKKLVAKARDIRESRVAQRK